MKNNHDSKFAQALKMSGKTASEVARQAGITPQAVCKLKKQGIKNTATAKRMAEIIGVDVFLLLEI